MAENTEEDLQEETPEAQIENDGGAEDTEEEEDSEEEDEDDKEDEDPVPVRSNVQNAQRRIIEKQAKKLAEGSSEGLSPQAKALIDQELAPLRNQITGLTDELSFRDYFRDHPEDAKFEKAARKRFEAWKDVPIAEIMKTLRPAANTQGKKDAEDKAAKGRINGATNRPQEDAGIAKTEAQFKKLYQNRKSGKISSADVLKALGVSPQ